MRVGRWFSRHDPGLSALRRAGRAAIVMPLLFAFGSRVVGNPDVAVFAAFGSLAMLLFVDFSGLLIERLQAYLALAVAGAVLVTLGTLASQPPWLSAVAMGVVGLAVMFAGSVSSTLASSSTALLLAFILPVTLHGSIASIAPRLLGWGIASAVAIAAALLLWPAPTREPLRGAAVEACRASAARLRAESAYLHGGDPAATEERDRTASEAAAAMAALGRTFVATPYRPTGLSAAARTVVRLVDELTWLNTVIDQFDRYGRMVSSSEEPAHAAAWQVKEAAADALETGAALLAGHGGDPSPLETRLERLEAARASVEAVAMSHPLASADARAAPSRSMVREAMIGLDPAFRAQELAYAVSTVARNIVLTARAERRTWWQRVLGRQPSGLPGPVAAAAERASGFIGRDSVWLRNSIRGAIALAVAVLIANLTGVQHSFWVVLGTLSVLRSNALSTGQTVLRGIAGTTVGVGLGALAVIVIGSNPVALWAVLPVAILVAGVAPAAISFAAGQAAFTILLVILFNIIAPTGWTVGLVRIEDIAIGCAVSLGVGALFWPRGASASLRKAVASAYAASIDYLAAAVADGVGTSTVEGPGASGRAPGRASDAQTGGVRAAAASRRLDDAFRTYLAERGPKQRPLAEVAAAVTGVAGVRLAADAVVALWTRQFDDDPVREAASAAMAPSVEQLRAWYRGLGESLVAAGRLPAPDARDGELEGRLADALTAGRPEPATAVRIVWTADYLEAVRRLESSIALRPLVDEPAEAEPPTIESPKSSS
ncbi:FUSC family protein [Leifsonia sp. AG29]|uniref:FUSC family protein n=1 Tax=Leifsonia sp. AG29 TaxID=2598860 RepID=UPI001E49BE03|nr:FUSC family protein [Leifsonia sp. AG29]